MSERSVTSMGGRWVGILGMGLMCGVAATSLQGCDEDSLPGGDVCRGAAGGHGRARGVQRVDVGPGEQQRARGAHDVGEGHAGDGVGEQRRAAAGDQGEQEIARTRTGDQVARGVRRDDAVGVGERMRGSEEGQAGIEPGRGPVRGDDQAVRNAVPEQARRGGRHLYRGLSEREHQHARRLPELGRPLEGVRDRRPRRSARDGGAKHPLSIGAQLDQPVAPGPRRARSSPGHHDRDCACAAYAAAS